VDTRARHALEDAIRQAVSHDLDQLATELRALRRTVAMLERAAGLATDRLDPRERREQAAALRAQGLSAGVIARATGVHRATTMKDLREVGAPRPVRTIGLDGYTRTHRPSGP
jgi:hypothetical protein